MSEKVRGVRLPDSTYKKICKLDPTGRMKFSSGLAIIIKTFFDREKNG